MVNPPLRPAAVWMAFTCTVGSPNCPSVPVPVTRSCFGDADAATAGATAPRATASVSRNSSLRITIVYSLGKHLRDYQRHPTLDRFRCRNHAEALVGIVGADKHGADQACAGQPYQLGYAMNLRP